MKAKKSTTAKPAHIVGTLDPAAVQEVATNRKPLKIVNHLNNGMAHETDVAAIIEHPILAEMPMLPEVEMEALIADIRVNGVVQPLTVCSVERGVYQLLDGRHRLAAARAVGLETVPCIERPESEAWDIVTGALVHRRHYSKSALAYILYPLIAEKIGGHGGDRKSSTLKANLKNSDDVDALCARFGFSYDVFDCARLTRKYFANHPRLKEEYEPKILSGEMSCAHANAAMGGELATKGQKRKLKTKFSVFITGWRSGFSALSTGWEKFDDLERGDAAAAVRATIKQLPEELYRIVCDEVGTQRKGKK